MTGADFDVKILDRWGWRKRGGTPPSTGTKPHSSPASCPYLGRRTLAIALILLAFLVQPRVTAQSSDGEADLQKLRQEISALRKSLQSVRGQARTAEQRLEALEIDLAIQTRELAIARQVESSLEQERETTEQRIGTLTTSLAEQRRYLSKRLAALYRLGGLGYLRILLSVDRRTNPFEAAAMLSYVVSRDARSIADMQATRAALSAQREDLARKESSVAAARRQVEEKTQTTENARKAKERLLAQLRSESRSSATKLAQLEEKARRLERLFALLYEKNDPTTLSGADIREFRGALEWPVHGKILEGFGPQRNPKFATVTLSNGLKIETDPLAEVRAVFRGTVLFSQWFKGYGNLMIVDHGNRVFSLYGNTQNPRVAVGDRVDPHQMIANVAEGEDGTAWLYFEIREDNKPTDPRKWLR